MIYGLHQFLLDDGSRLWTRKGRVWQKVCRMTSSWRALTCIGAGGELRSFERNWKKTETIGGSFHLIVSSLQLFWSIWSKNNKHQIDQLYLVPITKKVNILAVSFYWEFYPKMLGNVLFLFYAKIVVKLQKLRCLIAKMTVLSNSTHFLIWMDCKDLDFCFEFLTEVCQVVLFSNLRIQLAAIFIN